MGVGEMLNGRVKSWQEQADRIERWLAGHYGKLERIAQLMEEQGERSEYHRFATTIATDGTGTGNVNLPGRQGSHYELINISVTSVANETGALLVYMNGPHPSGLVHVVSMGQYTSDAFPEGTFIPAGVNMYLATVSAQANQTLYVNVLAKQLQQVPPITVVGGGEE